MSMHMLMLMSINIDLNYDWFIGMSTIIHYASKLKNEKRKKK